MFSLQPHTRNKNRPFCRTLFFVGLLITLIGRKEEKTVEEIQPVRHYKGDIEVLNSCGMQGAAAKMRAYLRENGFDVVSYRNDRLL